MASYTELNDLFGNSELRNRCEAAVIVSAIATLSSSPTVQQRDLINKVFAGPRGYAVKALYALVVSHRAKTKADILALTDADIQTVVDASALSLVTDLGA